MLTGLTQTLSTGQSQINNRQGNYQGYNRYSNPQSKPSHNSHKPATKPYNSYKGNPHRQTIQTNAIDECNYHEIESDHCDDEGTGHNLETPDTESKN